MDENELADILNEQYVIDNGNEENVQQEEEETNNDDNQVNIDNDTEEIIEEEENEDNEYVPPHADDKTENESNVSNENPKERTDANSAGVRRTTRQINVPTRYGTLYQHLHSKTEAEECKENSNSTAVILAHIMSKYAMTNTRRMSKKKFYQFVQTYTLNKGIKRFGVKGKRAAYKEMKQLHDRIVFKPI